MKNPAKNRKINMLRWTEPSRLALRTLGRQDSNRDDADSETLAFDAAWWEIAHMTTLVTADAKGRIPIRGSKPGQKYLVSQTGGEWRVTPFTKEGYPSRNRKEWTPRKGKGKLSDHLKAMWDLGLRLERSENAKAPVPPCPF